MSTAKFNISEMGEGNDTHSNFLISKGYGNLLNRPGRQEITIDTASMYKKAADQGAILGAGVGGIAGGIGGSEIAEALGGSATAKLMGALVGAGVGGVGGYYAGKSLDKVDKDNLTTIDKYRSPVYTLGGGALGALTGYGVSKYLMGSKNKTHHVLSALLGAGVGAGAGHIVSGREEYNEAVKDGLKAADKYNEAVKAGLITADKSDIKDRNRFAKIYAKYLTREKINPWYNLIAVDTDKGFFTNAFTKREEDALDAAIKEYYGEEDPREISVIKSIISGSALGGVGAGTTYGTYKGIRASRNAFVGKFNPEKRNTELLMEAFRMPNSEKSIKMFNGAAPTYADILGKLEQTGAKLSDSDLLRIAKSPATEDFIAFKAKYPGIGSAIEEMLKRKRLGIYKPTQKGIIAVLKKLFKKPSTASRAIV